MDKRQCMVDKRLLLYNVKRLEIFEAGEVCIPFHTALVINYRCNEEQLPIRCAQYTSS